MLNYTFNGGKMNFTQPNSDLLMPTNACFP